MNRHALAAAAVVVAAVVLRSWFLLAWDESYFDSDQAIVGLMAKHLSEGRSFPLFFYGQEYMLGVEAWLMAPVFAVLGASVHSLRLTMVLLNVATSLLLWRLLVRDARLNPWAAALAASPFALAPFVTSAHLLEAQGGNPEPFLWALLLWMVRGRPLLLGAMMGVAFLHREFIAYAFSALLIVHAIEARGRILSIARPWALTAFAFVAVFQGINALKPYADLLGPGTAGVEVASTTQDNVTLLVARANVEAQALPARFRALAVEYVPMLTGLDGFRPYLLSIGTDAHVGWRELLPIALVLGLAIGVGLTLELGRGRAGPAAVFPLYLVLIGIQAALVYALTRDLSMFTFRYGLLALYGPVGIGALVLQGWRPVWLRATGGALLGLLAAASAVDHVVVIQRSTFAPPPVRFARVAERLEARGVTVARATYWRAYAITFLTGERVRVASTDLQRIREYQRLADDHGPGVVRVQEEPCEGDGRMERVDRWFLCGGE